MERKLKLPKSKKSWLILGLFAAGLLLMVLPSLFPDRDKAEPVAASGADYLEQLEQRLQKTLSQIDGAGKVTVLLTADSRGRIAIAENVKSEERAKERDVVLTDRESPVVLEEFYPKICGAVIVAEGAASPTVRAALLRAAQAALHLEVNRIEVLERSR